MKRTTKNHVYYIVYLSSVSGWEEMVRLRIYGEMDSLYEAKLLAESKAQQGNIQYLVIYDNKIVALANPTEETVVKNYVKVTTF